MSRDSARDAALRYVCPRCHKETDRLETVTMENGSISISVCASCVRPDDEPTIPSDSEIGAAVRYTMRRMRTDWKTATRIQSCMFCLIAMALDMNADDVEIEQSGCTYEGKPVGDWTLVLKKAEPKARKR